MARHEKAELGVEEQMEVTELEAQKTYTNASRIVVTEELRKERARITWKVDVRLIPILGLMYAINGIDRTNLSVARIAGMEQDLGIEKGDRYSIALLMFFIPYFIFEIPSNLVIRKFGAANWLAFLSFAWGIVILGGAFAKDWTVVVGVRILIGVFEAGFFPGCLFLISCWYERYQIQKRIAVFYSVNLLAGGFGNILAYGINKLDGTSGYRGWRWIFIIEGLIPIVLAVFGWFIIVDFPDKVYEAKHPFLNADEVQIVKDRLEADRGDSTYDHVTFTKILHTLAMWQIWIYALLFMAAGTGIYAFAYFTSVILRGMGYTTDKVFLLSAPPAIAAIPYSYIIAWTSDRCKMRSPFVILNAAVCLMGLMITAYHPSNNVRYGGLFLGLAGCNCSLPSVLAWQANNIRGQSTRAVASALQVAFGAIGGIYASTTFMQKEAPKYPTGLWATAATQIFAIVASAGMVAYYRLANCKADKLHIAVEGHQRFRYTY
ncbi:MFS general substrate transporter [Delitschia confertaspora ATCC 74209]|uniref:MFS general substrate transporter n=1 Tax=Delitschia confertaspora ATCC 74209 TaxID=1513339 RepID=A0A9P4MVI5_9PLEO|nr:MFS general substrate transporter [Delitschia confertaspora ATCC 74209]